MLRALRFRSRWYFRESFLQSISTFLFLTFQRTRYPLLFSAAFLCCFSTFHPLVFSYISAFRLSLHNLFSCLLIPRLLSFLLSHGVSSSLLYHLFIIFQIMLSSLYLLNDHKMHLCAQHLRCSHCRRLFCFIFLSSPRSSSPTSREWLEKSSYSLLVIIVTRNILGSVHAGHMKDKVPNISRWNF